MKFILFILNFRNSNFNEFELTKILRKKKRGTVHLDRNWSWASFMNLVLLLNFNLYNILLRNKTNLIELWMTKNYGNFYGLRYDGGGKISKI
jgi:hypothetical protein